MDESQLHTECVARRHARAAASCVVKTVSGTAAAPALVEAGGPGGEPSKAEIMAERRARVAATASQLSVMLAGVAEGSSVPGGLAAFLPRM